MSVRTFDPISQNSAESESTQLAISHSATQHLITQQVNHPSEYLKLDLTNSGCSGFKYKLEYVTLVEKDDIEIQLSEHIVIYVPKIRYAMLKGTRIDYVTEGLNSSIKYSNPNADAECGCGESFSIKTSDTTAR
ncbi:MAG: iron-sulfur cluster assembly accessory protein [Pseudomonadales bacterium]|nr:iron-sulfur cluster assembly accessory protein [Pseudomonadales bacterium]